MTLTQFKQRLYDTLTQIGVDIKAIRTWIAGVDVKSHTIKLTQAEVEDFDGATFEEKLCNAVNAIEFDRGKEYIDVWVEVEMEEFRIFSTEFSPEFS